MRMPILNDAPALDILDCPVGPGGIVTVRGLEYRPTGSPDALFSLHRAGRAAVIVDRREYGEVLVREPRQGALLRAYALRAALARDLTLLVHIDGYVSPVRHGAEDRDLAKADGMPAGGHSQ